MRNPATRFALVLALGCGTAKPPADPASTTIAAAAVELDAAGQILEAAITATGGRAAKQRHTAMRASGAVRLPQLGASGRMELVWASPRRMKASITMPPLGNFGSGTDGSVVWEQVPMQRARILTGAEAERRLRDATFNADLQWRTLYVKIEVQGEGTVQDVPATKLIATARDGETTTLYFAKDSRLPLGSEATVETPSGLVPMKTFYSDYRSIDGVLIPFRTTIEQGPITIETTFDKVEWDPELPAAAFALPAELPAPPAR
jgi:hypothetical protein